MRAQLSRILGIVIDSGGQGSGGGVLAVRRQGGSHCKETLDPGSFDHTWFLLLHVWVSR